MELDKFGEEKIACYAVMSASDPTYNFLFAMMIWQLFDELMRQGATKYSDANGALPVGVDFQLDEFANYFIPNFEQTISVVRSYNIGAHIGVQSTSQMKEKYGEDNAVTITNNCDTLVFLGGKATETNKELAEIMGQQTVTTDNESDTHAQQPSWQKSIAQHGRDLLQPSEIAKMPKSDCLVLIQGADPYRGKKYDVTSHPLYDYIDPGPGRRFKRAFDYPAYLADNRYYAHGDAKLAARTEARLYLSRPATLDPPRRRAYVVLMQTTVENIGDIVAYDVRGTIRYDCSCLSNGNSRNPLFPLMEPFGTVDGLMFARSDTFTNLVLVSESGEVDDIIEWNDSNEAYTLYGVDIEPGEKVIYTTTLDANIEDVLLKMESPNSTASQECRFGFDYRFNAKCANHDALSSTMAKVLKVGKRGHAELVESIQGIEN